MDDVFINQGMIATSKDTELDTPPGFAQFADMFGTQLQLDRDTDIYYRYGMVNGVKVSPEYRDRMIPKDTPLERVFDVQHDVHVECFDICPGSEDISKYQVILQDAANNDVLISVHERTPGNGGYSVLLIYDRATMVFRKESYNKEYPPMERV